ncbi:HIT-like protein [Aspergillus brunneoviolaceus CBS 621.78]|uniref:HIT-like protein n=1 Tax=Aspergillus brunneoviolaceus CBS 621.78 TaxID=1450534 RepID=A0ACD1G979_9EURO|nr:HIT-like protein [Aspergillus brunneoviolaceus CBS 621.78]RAH45760.1 HIT-like protein [Aspergillus brunneoviolaceus CBS 621.78]
MNTTAIKITITNMADDHTPNTTIYQDAHLTVNLTLRPTTPGHTVATLTTNQTNLFNLPPPTFVETLQTLRTIASHLRKAYNVQRCALITTGGASVSILPLHGLTPQWTPVTHPTKEFHPQYPGYITSKDAPPLPTPQLNTIRSSILFAASRSPTTYHADHTFHGPDPDDANLFARIVRGELSPQWRVWEDARHVAFLTPYPNTPGFTVVVPRAHLSSDIFSLSPEDYAGLVEAAHTVAKLLIRAFGIERCGMIFEGFEIDYAHVKLVPIRGGGGDDYDEDDYDRYGISEPFQETYQGYVSSMPGPRVEVVEAVVKRAAEIRESIGSHS